MFPRVYRFALARVAHQEDAAEEIAQATLCRAVRRVQTWRGEASLFTWICTVPSIPSPPQLSVSHPTLYFGLRGTVLTPAQTEAVTVTNARGAAVSWTVSANQTWLTVAGSATGSGTFTVSVKPGTYAVGTLNGQVTVAAAGASPQTVDVTFTSYASTNAPWGSVGSPAQGATGVIGSIAVTGWALHQVGIQKISICREAVAAEGPPSSLVFIGDAVMVEGAARRRALRGQPFNYRAGWGLMVLTNMLPLQGNGTFTLHAVAYGLDGSVFELGKRTITCTNASATTPFGAIDTPAQGATVSNVLVESGAFSQVFTFVIPGGTTRPNMNWAEYSFEFLALADTTTLSFLSTTQSQFFGPALDDVSVTAVPEPASLLLVGSGVACFAARRRRAMRKI